MMGRGIMLEHSLNLAWILIAGFLVMFMQVGFAMLETGFTRAKNATNTMAMNLMIYPIGVIGFWLTGYAFMMGGVGRWASLGSVSEHRELTITIGGHALGFLGFSKFALANVSHDPGASRNLLFAVVFMDTAATVPTGAMAERWKFFAFFIYGFSWRCFFIRSTATGCGAEDGSPSLARRSAWVTGTSTSPVRQWFI